ncbi:hypothetical protein R1flu_020365 [Riccia fluitans]|uniref:Uncharacterized protein n=1 Tax=Riccia fluitans TaxID=41844 RepID=A0ABD1ZMG7_9MARC
MFCSCRRRRAEQDRIRCCVRSSTEEEEVGLLQNPMRSCQPSNVQASPRLGHLTVVKELRNWRRRIHFYSWKDKTPETESVFREQKTADRAYAT